MQATKWDIKRIMLKLYWELKGLEKAIEAELPHAPGWVGQRKQRTGEEVKYWFHYEGGKCKAMRIPKEQEEEYTKMVLPLLNHQSMIVKQNNKLTNLKQKYLNKFFG